MGLVFVGDSLNSYLVAVICVDPDVLKEWAASENIKVIKTLPLVTASLQVILQLVLEE